ncbi:MAG: hypothetical protein JNK57_16170 [Planctomycetaceae bacterium]|nr:hypothetical protein [Planctomycetaceae bacterium]
MFGISVVTGLLGSVGWLMRRNFPVILFPISFVAVVVQMIHAMVIASGVQVMGPSGAVMSAIVIVLACIWVVVSIYFNCQGWLSNANRYPAGT